jgi:hypothetical protein
MSDTILAVDLGRYKSVACAYHRATRHHTFRTIDTTPEDLAGCSPATPEAGVVEACANAGRMHRSASDDTRPPSPSNSSGAHHDPVPRQARPALRPGRVAGVCRRDGGGERAAPTAPAWRPGPAAVPGPAALPMPDCGRTSDRRRLP